MMKVVEKLMMKARPNNRFEFSSLLPVVALLAVATLAKFSAATQLFHLTH
ncbi:MAG TPA: hypothetical protein VGH13_23190 [Xanthobacteraceae bacterium]|jgi:hypothetical protein